MNRRVSCMNGRKLMEVSNKKKALLSNYGQKGFAMKKSALVM